MEEDTALFGKFDLMYGVTRAESFHMLSDAETKRGFSVNRRDSLISTYINSNYKTHVSVNGRTVLRLM